MRYDTILILDFGGQYCHLIGRRVREQGVYSEIVPHYITLKDVTELKGKFNVKGFILSGGPDSVYQKGAPTCSPAILEMGLPVLGLCYGHQLIAQMIGGIVEPAQHKEYGIAVANIKQPVGVLKGLGSEEKVWMSHGDTVLTVPKDYKILASSENSPVAAFGNETKRIYGLQWHPEVVHTEHGTDMLSNFLFEVCKCEPNWQMKDFIKTSVEEIKLSVKGKAIVALSGGIDSSTVTALTAQALGKNLTAVFVDHGFMRAGEPEFVEQTFKGVGIDFVSVKAHEQFLQKLKGITEPEKKRKIIGEEFVRVFEAEARKVGADFLVQGTIYPDRIESGFRKFSDKIKTHHNVAGLPTKMEFKGIVEPLRDLYKDEVRKVAEQLRLPKEIVWRQPFPGPGLAVRATGEITAEKIQVLRRADKIVTEEIEKLSLRDRLWQYFAVLTETKSTGVKGDARAYGYTVAIRAVESREAMTASFARIPYDVLERTSTRITNEIPQVVRVVYDITHKPPATIEWE